MSLADHHGIRVFPIDRTGPTLPFEEPNEYQSRGMYSEMAQHSRYQSPTGCNSEGNQQLLPNNHLFKLVRVADKAEYKNRNAANIPASTIADLLLFLLWAPFGGNQRCYLLPKHP